MKIVVAGGSGFVGEPLVRRLVAGGHDVTVLSRNPSRVDVGRGVEWHPPEAGAWGDEVAAADVVINLAGENIGEGRWTEARKKRLVSSRVDATRALVEALRRDPSKQRTFINASAIGYYGHRGDDVLTEDDPPRPDFLSVLVQQWEMAARQARDLSRLVILRFGIVLAPDGGALQKLLTPFRLFVGGPVGNGRQWMSWVDHDDALRMIEWAIAQPSATGIYNVTAPNPVQNSEFAKTLGRVLHRPAVLPAPAFALKLLLGEMATPLLLESQRVIPARAMREGFVFGHSELAESLRNQISSAM